MLDNDTYKTIENPSEGFFKDRGSKFYSFAYPVRNEEEIKRKLLDLRELHPKAVHHCYAWRLGTDKNHFRANDDGEPSGSAGRPILNTIYSAQLTNLLVVVVRYFGGTLLGVPGLINAYKVSTEAALVDAEVVEKSVMDHYLITFPYEKMNQVMRIVKEMELTIYDQQFDLECQLKAEVRQSLKDSFLLRCENADLTSPEYLFTV
jgi:uncharacterized YigZ family protein